MSDIKSSFENIPMKHYLLTAFTVVMVGFSTNYEIPVASSFDNICLVDRGFNYTKDFNKFLIDNPFVRKLMVILSSLLIDFSVFGLFYVWTIHGKCWRTPIICGLFYALRGICNNIYQLTSPSDLIWDFPGIPSFSVSYHPTTDFFFSGHVGINLIGAIVLKRMSFNFSSYIAFVGVFFQILVMISVRGHYVIDLIAGLLSAHYFILISEYVHKIGNFLIFDFDADKVVPEIRNCIKND